MRDPLQEQSGFTLVELLISAAIFAFIVTAVSGLFLQALELQRRASGIQKIQENALYVLETITREIRVSTITSGDTTCAPPDAQSITLVIEHPVNGTVTYVYSRPGNIGSLARNGQPITSDDVDVSAFAFCVSNSTADALQTRVTIPMTLQTLAGRSMNSVSLQTTIVSRDLSVDF